MCRRIDCRKCGRPTYAGCGLHIEQVLGEVPPAERCRCREVATAAPPETAKQDLRSRLRALFGK